VKKVYYTLVILGIVFLIIGIIASLKMEDCYNKTPKEFFESRVCKWLIKE
jgi:multisubunit Na+/H+ antiporter MnhG subunit